MKIIFGTCSNCANLHTRLCPIRVWARNEKYKTHKKDIDVKKDYCSRYRKYGSQL